MKSFTYPSFNPPFKILLILTIFSLPWQTKLILRPAPINYWEISLFLPMILLLIITLFNWRLLLKNFQSKKIFSAAIVSLVVLEFFIIISLFFSPDVYLSLWRYLVFLLAAILFLLVRQLSKREKKWALFSWLVAISGHALVGIWQFLSQDSVACKYLGLVNHQAARLGTSVVESSSGRWLRSYGGFDHPNVLGGLTALSSLLIVDYLLTEKIKQSREKIFLLVVYFILVAALFFSFSRSAWLVFIFGHLFLLGKTYYYKLDKQRIAFLLGATIVLLSFLIIPFQDLVSTRLLMKGRLENISITERQDSLKQLSFGSGSQFLFGRGLGASTFWRAQVDEQAGLVKPSFLYQPIHNVWLLLWLEIGFFGVLAFFLFLLSLVIKLIKTKQLFNSAAILVLLTWLVLFMFDHWIVSSPLGWWSLFFSLALIDAGDDKIIIL